MKYFLIALRPNQWIKNLFIFIPLIFGRKLFIFPQNLDVFLAGLAFCLMSSAGYLINDIIDKEKDRLHPVKRLRPIASEKLSIKQALLAAWILGLMSITLSFTIGIAFAMTVLLYIMFNLLYTRFLKKLVIIDVFCLAGFFLIRIIAGAIVVNVQLSHWILFMTTFLALFLGFNKRRQELRLVKGAIYSNPALTKYNIYFIDQLIGVTTSSVVLTYMLYTVDSRTVREFGTSHLIYSIPFVYYGVFRYFYLIHKHHRYGDPTRILLSDRKLQLDLFLWLVVCILVIYFKI